MTSWLVRQADANLCALRAFISSYLWEGRWDRRDLDLLEKDEVNNLSYLGRVQGREEKLWGMALTPWKQVILQTRADQKAWISSLSTIRYCPACLSKDDIPYQRLLWRLHFVPICPEHRVLLQSGCWNKGCRYSQPIVKFNKGICISCGSQFSDVPIVRPKNCYRLINFVSTVLNILNKCEFPESLRWSHSVGDFFSTLLLLVRYFNQYMPKEAPWEELFNNYDLPLNNPFDWRKNEAVACILLEQSLLTIENWSNNMEEFVRRNQSRFNRFCAEYGARIPNTIERFIRKKEHYSNHAISHSLLNNRFSMKRMSSEEKVTYAMEYLLESNACPFAKSISRITGISSPKLKQDSVLSRIIQEGIDRFSKKQEEDIRKAVITLRARRKPVTARAVAAYLGRSHRYVRKWDLSSFR